MWDRHERPCPDKGRSAVRRTGTVLSAYRDLGVSAVTVSDPNPELAHPDAAGPTGITHCNRLPRNPANPPTGSFTWHCRSLRAGRYRSVRTQVGSGRHTSSATGQQDQRPCCQTAPGRPHPVDLLLCSHHLRVSRAALKAAGPDGLRRHRRVAGRRRQRERARPTRPRPGGIFEELALAI